jgi:predicted Zn-dependent peptidase
MFEKTTLANGLRVITGEMPHTRSATVSVYVGAGSRYEADSEAGLSHFLEHMLFKGASRRPTAQAISEAIESVGGVHNAATDREATVYYAKVPDSEALTAIDILSDMVRAPVMDAGELEKERFVILEELAAVEDSPGELTAILADATLWPDQPLGRNVGGTPDTVQTLPLSEVRRYMKSQYVPENMVLVVAGNAKHAQVAATAERWLGGMPSASPKDPYPIEDRPGSPRLAVRKKATEQANICISFPALPLDHPDRYALDLVNALLGEGMSSRLFLELREEQALVYDVHSYVSEYRDAGSLTIFAACEPRKARTTAEACLEETARMLETLTPEELQKGIRMAAGRIQLRMEDTRSVAGWLGSQELLLSEILTVDQVVEKIESVDMDSLVRVGRDILVPEKASIAAVGPFEDDSAFTGLI